MQHLIRIPGILMGYVLTGELDFQLEVHALVRLPCSCTDAGVNLTNRIQFCDYWFRLACGAVENENVKRIFGIPGGENLVVVESLKKSYRFDFDKARTASGIYGCVER